MRHSLLEDPSSSLSLHGDGERRSDRDRLLGRHISDSDSAAGGMRDAAAPEGTTEGRKLYKAAAAESGREKSAAKSAAETFLPPSPTATLSSTVILERKANSALEIARIKTVFAAHCLNQLYCDRFSPGK